MRLIELSRGNPRSFRERESRERVKIGTWRFRARDFLAVVNSELREKRTGADLIAEEISFLPAWRRSGSIGRGRSGCTGRLGSSTRFRGIPSAEEGREDKQRLDHPSSAIGSVVFALVATPTARREISHRSTGIAVRVSVDTCRRI